MQQPVYVVRTTTEAAPATPIPVGLLPGPTMPGLHYVLSIWDRIFFHSVYKLQPSESLGLVKEPS